MEHFAENAPIPKSLKISIVGKPSAEIAVDDIIESAAFLLKDDARYQQAIAAGAKSKAAVLAKVSVRRAIEQITGEEDIWYSSIEDQIIGLAAELQKFLKGL